MGTQLVAGDGTVPADTTITVSNPATNQTQPDVDANESSWQYLVTWSHASDPPFLFVGIHGRAVSTVGVLLGGRRLERAGPMPNIRL
jgi:hypothetical protein